MVADGIASVAGDEGLLEFTMYTWLGTWFVSEKTARVPLREVARAFPITVPSDVNAGLLEPKADGITISAPKSLPIQTRLPVGSETNEFGETGNWVAFPAEDAVVTLYPNVLQEEGSSCAHPVLEEKTAGVEVDPVTVPVIAATCVGLGWLVGL